MTDKDFNELDAIKQIRRNEEKNLDALKNLPADVQNLEGVRKIRNKALEIIQAADEFTAKNAKEKHK